MFVLKISRCVPNKKLAFQCLNTNTKEQEINIILLFLLNSLNVKLKLLPYKTSLYKYISSFIMLNIQIIGCFGRLWSEVINVLFKQIFDSSYNII